MLLLVLSPLPVYGASLVSGTRSSGGSGAFLLPGQPIRKQGGSLGGHLGQPHHQLVHADRLEQRLLVDGTERGDSSQLPRTARRVVVESDHRRGGWFAELRLVRQRPAHCFLRLGEGVL